MKKKNCLTVLSLTLLLAVSGCSTKKNDASSSLSSSLSITDSSSSEPLPDSSVVDSSIASSEEEIVLTSIRLDVYPETEFEVGETISVEGGSLRLTYSDGNSEVIALSEDMLSFPDDMTTAGNKTVKVSYEGKETTYTITLTETFEKPTVVFSIENGASFAYDGTSEAPDISARVVEENVEYSVFFEKDGTYIGTEIPTEPGTYAIVIETEAGNGYEQVREFRWFVIEDTATVKVVIQFSETVAFDYDGQAHTPTILGFTDESGNPLNIEESAYTVRYTSDDTGYDSAEAPIEAAYYAMVVTFNADSGYEAKVDSANGIRNWCVFHIDAPTEDIKVIVNFSSDTEFVYDGNSHAPTIASFTDESGNPLEISADKYTVHYEKNEVFYSNEAPSESGTYAMVVTFAEGSGYAAKVDTANGIRNWCVFTINAPVEDVVVNVKFGSTVAFEYDGEPHSPTIVSFTDENGGTLEIPAGAYTIHYSSDSTGYFSSEAPREVAWYSMVITFSDDSGYVLSNGSKKLWCVFHIDEAQVSASYEGFESIYSGSMSNVVDGDDDTFVWFGSVPTTDSTITVDLKKVTEISDIRILTGNATGTDTFDAVVSVSENGVDYVEVGNLSYGTTLATVDLRNQEQSARYIRLSALDSGGAWVALKEISVNQLPALNKSVSYGNISLETSVQTSANYMIDGDLSTYAWFGYNRTEGAYLLLDLLEVKTIDTMTLYMGKDDSPDDYFHHYEILTSENGTDYVSLGTFEAKELTLNLETAVNARYVKVLALSLDADNGIVVREFSAEKSPVKVEAVTDRWGSEEDGNQGVSAENVTFNDDGSILVQMKGADRIGGVVKSVERYGEGSFEIVASTTATSGVATAFWLYYNDGVHNYEIDIEMWGDNHIWLTSWVTESDYKTVQLNLDYTLSSDERHTYRIDWYSGTKAEFYVDNVLLTTITEYVPTEPMYLYMGGWCPDWAGDPVSSDSTITIESFSYREW